jgi:hypothetical protein
MVQLTLFERLGEKSDAARRCIEDLRLEFSSPQDGKEGR